AEGLVATHLAHDALDDLALDLLNDLLEVVALGERELDVLAGELRVEIGEGDGTVADLRREAPHLVLELAHVAGVLVAEERVHRLDVELVRGRAAVAGGEGVEKDREVLLA